jgi:hypothetical protein
VGSRDLSTHVVSAYVVLLICTSVSIAQPLASPTIDIPSIKFSGRTRFTAQSAAALPASTGLPEQFARWEFDPTLSLYDVPFSAHVLLTTENDASRHAMNSIAFEFDVNAFQKALRERVLAQARATATDFKSRAEALKAKLSDPSTAADLARYKELSNAESAGTMTDSARAEMDKLRAKTEEARAMERTARRYAEMNPADEAREKEKEARALGREITDPSKLEAKLKEMDLFSGAEKFMFGFKNLGAGVNYPNYSPIVLTGLPVTGVAMEYSLGILTLAGSGGKVDGPIPDGRTAIQTFGRTLYAGKLGLGATEGTHFHLIGMYARDDETSAMADSAYSPQSNHVIAADAKFEVFNRAVVLSGQAAGSILTRDVNAASIEIAQGNDPSGLGVMSKLDPKISTSLDYAWSLNGQFNLFDGATKATIAAKMIGPGYATLGVPYLRSDVFGQEFELDQTLFSGQVSIGGYFKNNQDNILPWKRAYDSVAHTWHDARTSMTSYGIQLGEQIQGVPFVRLEYAPFLEQTDIEGEGSGVNNNTEMISVTAGHVYQLFGGSLSTSLSGLSQTGTSSAGTHDFVNRSLFINQTIICEIPLMLSLSGSHSQTELSSSTTTIDALTGSATYTMASWINGTAGLSYSTRNDGGTRVGFSVRALVKLWKGMQWELRAEQNSYDRGTATDVSCDQLRLRTVLSSSW